MLLAYSLIGCIAGAYAFAFGQEHPPTNKALTPGENNAAIVVFAVLVAITWPVAIGLRLYAHLENN